MGPRVDGVLTASHVVGGVIEPHDLVKIHAVLLDAEAAEFFGSETVLVPVVLSSEHTAEEMVSEVRVEVLHWRVRYYKKVVGLQSYSGRGIVAVVLQPLKDVGRETLRVGNLITSLRRRGGSSSVSAKESVPPRRSVEKVGTSSLDGGSGRVAGRLAWGSAVA